MKILGIETSCDDTCIAIINAQKKNGFCFDILSDIVSSQIEIHKKWGGVWPTLAKRAHQQNLVPVLEQSLKKAGKIKVLQSKSEIKKSKLRNLEKILKREPELLRDFVGFISKFKKPKIDILAVTTGPGLEPCLWTGVNFARALSFIWNIPLVAVNHIEAHIYANLINHSQFIFPAICLVVSGGHTQLILMKDYGKYKILGETRDDAAGECLDKIARILGLEYPGGPIIAKLAERFKKEKSKTRINITLPRPMIFSKNYDFSFSGLKTAVLYDFKKRSVHTQRKKEYIYQMCFEAQQAVIDVLIKKTIKATKNYKAKAIILGGGVSANTQLQKQITKKVKQEIPGCKIIFPLPQYCTDNAVMTAIAGFFHKKDKKSWQEVKAEADLRLD
ncbi:tRNA (adenosine(37)-N6)-threonylcarbamoyltransferase complex transferase subunit TsaD [bacterium]|nr:tRNA (adenosine(37)-N6)-threonylcarbamoyltransferase complex transferase subunit TsaD [bacterium]